MPMVLKCSENIPVDVHRTIDLKIIDHWLNIYNRFLSYKNKNYFTLYLKNKYGV